MAKIDFIHLRVHSAYTLSNGAIPIKQLIDLCHKFKMPAVAVTDSNNLFGAIEFSELAKTSGIQPIIGCKLQLNFGDAVHLKNNNGFENAIKIQPAPVIVLVKNKMGYQNLLKLLAFAYIENDIQDPPQIPITILEKYNEGLILLTGGADGPLGFLILNNQLKEANNVLDQLASAFKGNIYIEIMRHGLETEHLTESVFLELAYSKNIPLVATNEVFFPDQKMYESHDALLCIEEKAYISQENRLRKTPEHYFKAPKDMIAVFADLPEAINNTVNIAKRCAFLVKTTDPILPPFDCAENQTEEDTLISLSKAGLKLRLQKKWADSKLDANTKAAKSKPYAERLQYELDIIAQMGFPGYFLIVADIIQWAKKNDIPVGPGRGSGAGSLVAWALTITDLDPLQWGLLFERFLNPERISMPDFDIDFCQDKRDEVIQYVQKKYGRDRVAQIITFGKLQSRAVLRDVGRVLEIPYGQVDRICKLIPNNPANPTTLSDAIESEPILKNMIKNDGTVKKLVEIARPLEGLYRHASTHAAGVVIGDRPLKELIPLYSDPKSDIAVTGYNMKYVEAAGLVKFDFLGLKTLTVLATTLKLIEESGKSLSLPSIPLNDRPSFEMMSKGDTTGVFQLESAGMRDVLKTLRPDSFEDIIAVVALYRPGPMDNIPSYIRRKHGTEEVSFLHPSLESVLKETYGIMIYQEQVMQIAQILAGYSLAGADILRRAMGKKIKSEMDQQRRVFIDGAKSNGVTEEKSEQIFEQVNKFAGYGFNKSHAAAYALIAYQTAFLKANYPLEFLAASMTLDINNTEKLNIFCSELKRLGISLLPPDINNSLVTFGAETQNKDGKVSKAIRYALAAIRNVGQTGMKSVLEEREKNGKYKSVEDFVSRLDTNLINKRQLEGLIKAGAFDSLDENRRKLFSSVDSLIKFASFANEERGSSQIALFSDTHRTPAQIPIQELHDWDTADRLKEEFNAIGFYLSAHPLDTFSETLSTLKIKKVTEVNQSQTNGSVKLAGTILGKKERVSAKGNRYAFVQCSDSSGPFEVTVFSDTLEASRDLIEVGKSVIIDASAKFSDGQNEAKLLANQFLALEEKKVKKINRLLIFIENEISLNTISEILQNARGGDGEIEFIPQKKGYEGLSIRLDSRYQISQEIGPAIKSLPGVIEVKKVS